MGTQNHRSPPTLGPWGIGTPRDPPTPDSAPWCLGTFVNAGMGHVGTAMGTRTPTPVGTAPQVPPRWGWGCSSAAGCPPTPPPHVTQCPLMPPTQRSQAGEEEEEEGDSTPQPRRPHGWHLAGRWDKDLGDTGTPPHLGDPPALVNPPPQHDRDPSPLYWEAEPPRPPPDLCGSPIPQKSPTAPSPPPWVPQPNPTSTPH